MPQKRGVEIVFSQGSAYVDIYFNTHVYCVQGFRSEDAKEFVSHSRDVRLETKDLEIGKLSVVANAITSTAPEIVHAVQHVLDCLVEVS